MIHALLHGKLSREQENLEDVLTSNVFGVFSYVELQEGLLPFLVGAESIAPPYRPLEFLAAQGRKLRWISRPQFWPTWSHDGCAPCEPDVVLRLEAGDRRLMLCVEAKYLSGKSGEADDESARPVDQLAKEWDNLVHQAATEGLEPFLIYLTADVGCPIDEIESSIREFMSKHSATTRPQILWLSWRRLSIASTTSPAALDVAALMRRLGLVYFSGFGKMKPVVHIGWSFDKRYRWEVKAPDIKWRFGS